MKIVLKLLKQFWFKAVTKWLLPKVLGLTGWPLKAAIVVVKAVRKAITDTLTIVYRKIENKEAAQELAEADTKKKKKAAWRKLFRIKGLFLACLLSTGCSLTPEVQHINKIKETKGYLMSSLDDEILCQRLEIEISIGGVKRTLTEVDPNTCLNLAGSDVFLQDPLERANTLDSLDVNLQDLARLIIRLGQYAYLEGHYSTSSKLKSERISVKSLTKKMKKSSFFKDQL